MIFLENITMNFGERYLFDNISTVINVHDRIGLVGSNGAGKSTLLKIIAGINKAEQGNINKAHYVSVGYLPQDAVVSSEQTLYKEVETAFDNILLLEKEIEEVLQRMSELSPETSEYMETLELYGELQHKLEEADAFRIKSKIETVLLGLGFSLEDMERVTKEFSGGWQMRIALAKLLLKEPSLLLLDEPTNHLDIESLQWLEEYLKNYNGAIILVSHDRAFLDSLTKKTFALSLGKMEEYSGNYSFYEKEKVIRKELTLNAYKNQQQQLKQTQDFIDRFRYKATKARQVQSRIKQMEKIDMIEIEDEEEEIHFHFPQAQPSGRTVMELKNLKKSFGEKTVFSGLEYLIERGDRIAIVGVNGAGKSTFSKIVAGVEPFDSGERIIGHNVAVSYFAQHQADELDLSKGVLEILDDVALGEIRTKLRTILGSFLFHGDDVFKKVKVLSGGEKSRLALAKMLVQPSNFLIMDEPTNHLDMRSKKVLQEALLEFGGTYMIVSHDRAFLDSIVNKVLEIHRNGIKTYLGNVSEYLAKKKSEQVVQTQKIKNIIPQNKINTKNLSQNSSQKNTQKKIEMLESAIAKTEQRKKELEELMGNENFYKDAGYAKKITDEYKNNTKLLEQHYKEWEQIL